MTLYNAIIETNEGKYEAYTLKTNGKMQFNVPERKKAIDYLTANYGRVIRIDETNSPHTLIGFIEIIFNPTTHCTRASRKQCSTPASLCTMCQGA